jgi:hypothetical protein
MALVGLEVSLLKAREEIVKAKQANDAFADVLRDIKILKSQAATSSEEMQKISKTLKEKQLLELFSSIEKDFDALKGKIEKQEIEKEQLKGFIELMQTRKSFVFNDTHDSMEFLENAFSKMDDSHFVIRPVLIGMVDLAPMAMELGFSRDGSSIIVEKERFSEAVTYLLSKRNLCNVAVEGVGFRVILKNSREITFEGNSEFLREIARKE